MGCNIHAHIEVRLDDAWHHFAAPVVERNYELFALLGCDSRREDGLERLPLVSTHKSLPEDMSVVTKTCLENDRGYGLHDFGYITSEEIWKLQHTLADLHPEIKRTGIDPLDLEYSIFHTYIGGNCIASHDGFDDVRIVYWFDN